MLNYRTGATNVIEDMQQASLATVVQIKKTKIVSDFDGTLYEINQQYRDSLDESAALTAVEMVAEQGGELSYEEALEKSKAGVKRDGVWYKTFCDEYGFSPSEFHANHMAKPNIDTIIPDKNLIPTVKGLGSEVTLAIYTHGNVPLTEHILEEKVGLLDEFKGRIYDLDFVEFNQKNKNTKGFGLVMDEIQAKPYQSVMLDDSLSNLQQAKNAGLSTVLISKNKDVEKPDYVDYVCENAHEFFEKLSKGEIEVTLSRGELLRQWVVSGHDIVNDGGIIRHLNMEPMMMDMSKETTKPALDGLKIDKSAVIAQKNTP